MPNASPFEMPSASSPFANSETRVAASAHVTGSQPPSRSARYAVDVRCSASASSQSAGTVRARDGGSTVMRELTPSPVPGTCLAHAWHEGNRRRVAKRASPPTLRTGDENDVERIDQLRAGQHPDRPGAGDEACRATVRRLVPAAAPRVYDGVQAEALVPRPRT